ncbi:MAG: hypothetical protein N2572_01160, partial [Syntrophales bacterium]|nr:hypothetical protein [Syntrophales bacterium]
MRLTVVKPTLMGMLCFFLLAAGNHALGATIEDYVKQYRDSTSSPWRSIGQLLKEFYAARAYQPAWDRAKAMELLQVIRNAEKEGLDSRVYNVDLAAEIIQSNDSNPFSPREDIFFTEIFLRYALHVSCGRLDPEKFYPEWRPYKRDVNLIASLQSAIETGEVAQKLAHLTPRHPTYQRMKEELTVLKRMVAEEIELKSVQDVLLAFGDLKKE